MANNLIVQLIKRSVLLILVCLLATFKGQAAGTDTLLTIPIGGNSWASDTLKAKITDEGLIQWSGGKISIYVRVESAGDLNIGLKLKVPGGSSKLSIATPLGTLSKIISNRDFQDITFGHIVVKHAGYIKFDLKADRKTGAMFANVSDLLLSGPAIADGAVYVKNNKGNYYYWGRRGPSVHLNYKLPDAVQANTEWFYNEVTVPVGNDVMNSYFMADGFTGGYFGMQVNSPTERRVLFSIWSPFNTDDPKSIPDSLKIQLLKKGDSVHAGEFGSEGSGGQSYMNYRWVAGKTYAFLVHAQADLAKKTTVFTAYFKPIGQSKWQLIASFKRPVSGFYLKGLYSFLENFEPVTGTAQRKVLFGNQWVIDTAGRWYPLIEALFTGDATANMNYRKDYSGGVQGSQFYLRNCGFFDDFTVLRSPLMREQPEQPHPQIDFKKLADQ